MLTTIFDGVIEVDVTPRNMKTMVVEENMKLAIPEWKTFLPGSTASNLFNNLAQFLSRTRSLKAHDAPVDGDSDAAALIAFWIFANSTSDYRAIWDAFLMLDLSANNEWIEAMNRTIDPRLLAPPIVHPGAPTDSQLEALDEVNGGDEGKKKKKPETTTSNA